MFSLNPVCNSVVICLFGILMPFAECEYTTSNLTNPENEYDFIKDIECSDVQKMTDVCFKNLPPELMEFMTTKKVAVSKDEITSKCTVFKRGMECFQRYTERCLSKKKHYFLQNNVAGAKKFLKKFCDDRKFQIEYNRHKQCFSDIQEDWNKCTKEFEKILMDEFHDRIQHNNVTTKFMHFCCARNAYENCVYNSARFKCYKNAARFARDTAKMLTDEKMFTNCRRFENLLCAAAENHEKRCLIFLLLSSLLAVLWRSKNS